MSLYTGYFERKHKAKRNIKHQRKSYFTENKTATIGHGSKARSKKISTRTEENAKVNLVFRITRI